MIYETFALSPLGALLVDAFATFFTQFAYSLMKLSQISVEKEQATADEATKKSGFCTC